MKKEPRPSLAPAAGLSLLVVAATIVIGLLAAGLPGPAWPLISLTVLVAFNYLNPSSRVAMTKRSAFALLLMSLAIFVGMHFTTIRTTLRGWKAIGLDHLQLESRISMFPERIFNDRPQRFLVEAARSQRVSLRAEGLREVQLTGLGSGLFRWDFDPRRDGLPKGAFELISDGDGIRRLDPLVLKVGPRPGMLCSDPVSGKAATVSEPTDEALVADRAGNLHRFPVGYGPTACALFSGGQRLVVGHRYGQSLWILDTSSGKPLAKASLPGLVENLAVSPSARLVAVVYEGFKPGLALYELPSLRLVTRLELPNPGDLLCFGRNDDEIIVASRRDRCLLQVTHDHKSSEWRVEDDDRPLSMPATALTRSPGGDKIYLASTSGQLDGGDQLGNHYIQNVIMALDLKSWSWADVKITEARHGEQALAGSVDSGVGATDLHGYSGKGGKNELLVTFSGSSEVASFPLENGIDTRHDLSESNLLCPQSAVDLGVGVHLVSYPAQAVLAWLKPDWTVARTARLAPDDEALKSSDYPAWFRRAGEISFYETTNAGISCQSCHTKGDSDYAEHDIGGPTLWGTLSLQGIAGTAPYLRDASYPSLADLHSVALAEYRGYRRDVDYDRGEAIGAYIESLPLPVNPRQLLASGRGELERERRGVQAFVKADCVQCHSFPATTNLASVPNQTLFPAPEGPPYYEFLDVPSLRAVWRSAPYLHDGRARTLEDVMVTENPHDQHGNVAALTKAERSDLIAFLRSL